MNEMNSLAFMMQGGAVTLGVALVLLVMSVLSWYFMLTKTRQVLQMKAKMKAEAAAFWAAPNLEAAFRGADSASPVHRLSQQALVAAQHHQAQDVSYLNQSCTFDEFVARSMRRSVAETAANLEQGLSVLASVGSVAPFVGLFGTVWGIYHALAAMGASGQATLDKVAGPVGEALIMTAIGLVVAIPAVLAYNAFVKQNRVINAKLDAFAQDLHIVLTTGAPLATAVNARKMKITPLSQVNTTANMATAGGWHDR
jgi:biopolymer transport protein ExbB